MRDEHVFVGLAGESLSNRVTTKLGTGLLRCSAVDAGRWEWLDPAPDPEVRAIAIQPDSRTVFVGTQHGVHRSDDLGSTWRLLDLPAPEYGVWSLALHPACPDVVLAGFEPSAVYRSEDGGRSWRAAELAVDYPGYTAHEPKRVIDLAFDPRDPDRVYGAIEVGGVVASADGGRSWRRSRVRPHVDAEDVHAIGVTATGVVAAGRVGVFASRDRGHSWDHTGSDAIVVDGIDADRIRASVREVSDRCYGGNIVVGDLAQVPGGVRLQLTARRPGRDDYGGGFDPAGRGARRNAEGRDTAAACWHAWVTVLGELFERGATRCRGALGEIASRAVLDATIAEIAEIAEREPARCDCNEPEARDGALARTRIGRRWWMAEYCRSVAIDPDDPARVWVGAGTGYLGDTGAVYESRDGGTTWSCLALPPEVNGVVFCVAASRAHPGSLFAATKDGQLWYSRDRGASWRDAKLPRGADPIYALAVT